MLKRTREWHGPRRVFAVVLFLSVALPISLFFWTAWRERGQALEEGERTAVRTLAALHEQALKVLETHELVLDEIARQTGTTSWEAIENDRSLWEYLFQVDQRLEQVSAITLVDGLGRVRMTTSRFPAPVVSVADRDYFLAQRDRDAGTYVSAPQTGRLRDERLVVLSRRRTGPNGGFEGVIAMTIPVSYFTGFWEQFAPNIAHVIPLVRADGQIIARYPATNNPERLDIGGPFLSRALVQPRGVYTATSLVDGIESLNAYTRIKDYPLFVSFSIETRAILERWREGLLLHGLFSGLAATALAVGAVMGWRRYQAQAASSRRWEEAAERLKAEMSRRETAEAALLQSQKMEAIGQLTGGIAHDFNNLLMAVLGSLELAKKHLAGAEDRVTRLIDNAIQGARRGATLTQRMLAFARQQELKPQPVNVPDLVVGMTDLLKQSLGSKIRIETRFALGVSDALVDANQLELAILNLAVNARDAMPDGGTVTIELDEEVIRAGASLQPGSYVRLRVTDTGVGMDEQTLKRATEPFFTTKDPGKGTGLGLSMVHGLAAQSGGSFVIRSEPGRGTSGEVLLPVAPARTERPAAPSLPREVKGLRKHLVVLVVDDDPIVLIGTASMIEHIGHTAVEARSGGEALELLRSGRTVDVVLTDQVMPGITGTELATTIRREWPELPIVLATGYADPPVTVGDLMVLTKPLQPEDLAAALARAVELSTPMNIVPLRPRRP
jgi:signal transduction histidine kinase/ActR/RegA family two-component response regulator